MASAFSLPEEDLAFIHSTLGVRTQALNGDVLVTGANGFFGRWVVEALVWMRQKCAVPISVHVLLRDAPRFLAEAPSSVTNGVHVISGEMEASIATRAKFKHIIHLASPLIRPNDVSAFHAHMHIAARGMDQILELARDAGDCTVLFTSSGAIYGDYLGVTPARRPYEENFTGEPASFLNEKLIYGQTKRYLELLLLTSGARHGFSTRIARCFSFIGPYLPLDSNYAIGNFMRNALDGKSIVIEGDGKVRRSYMYAADMVIALLAILLDGRNGAAYNVGASRAYSLLEVAHLVAAQVPGCAVEVLNRALSTGAGAEYVPDLFLFERDFGGLPAQPIEQAIRKTLMWHHASGGALARRQAN